MAIFVTGVLTEEAGRKRKVFRESMMCSLEKPGAGESWAVVCSIRNSKDRSVKFYIKAPNFTWIYISNLLFYNNIYLILMEIFNLDNS